MWKARLEKAQAGIRIAGRNINNLRYADDTTLMAESKEALKSLLMKVKEESEKVGWKLNIQEAKIMASGPITSWQIDGKQWKQWENFLEVSSKITADDDLLLGRKAMTNLDKLLKSRDIQFRSVQELSHVWLFATPWITARQPSLSILG